MYSFEGDYRRKPQQNLAGASRRDEKSALLQHAHLERVKREQQRIKHNATVKIQAHVRSFIIRQAVKRQERCEFDKLQQFVNGKQLSLNQFLPFIKKILFFYNQKCDGNRLIWLLQYILKLQKEINLQSISSTDWLWRIKWILKICMKYSLETILSDSTQSIAIPFRILEVFTTPEDAERVIGSNSNEHLKEIFAYLVKNKYFEQVRCLIDAKVPHNLEPSSIPPTPMAKWFLEMIQRPLCIVNRIDNANDFCYMILHEYCKSILSQKLTDPISAFIIPALLKFKEFPYDKLINCINRYNAQPTINLLFCVLQLEPAGYSPGKSKSSLVNYLQVLASLGYTLNPPLFQHSISNDKDDSDSDEDTEMLDSSESETIRRCIEMLNEECRVQGLLLAVDQSDDQVVMQPLCQLCHNLLITNKNAIHKYKLLYMLAFKPAFLRQLWSNLLTVSQTSLFGGSTPYLHIISSGIALSADDTSKIVPLLAVFCSLFSLLIATLHDTEFFVEPSGMDMGMTNNTDKAQQTMPFTTYDLVVLSSHLKGVCLGLVELAFPDTRLSVRDDYKNAVHGQSDSVSSTPQNTQMWTHLFKVTVGLLRQLHTRDLRRQYCPDGHWICSNIVIPINKPQDFSFRRGRLRNYVPFQGFRVFTREEIEDGPPMSTKEVRTLTFLREIPFVVPFNERVVIFQSLINRDKCDQQGELTHFMQGPSIHISVRRNYLYEDAFDKLSPENEPEMRLKMRVQLVNSVGLEEAGVDGGGLFREFLSELLKTSFDPNRGFFRLTKDNMLYPNPTVHLLVDNFPKHYYFIGRILGKALYENLLVELPFAEFFLSKIVGMQSDVDVHHLASLDPVMYKNLLYLKSYKGDVTDLGLDFTILSDELGERRVDELKPGGSNVPVTNHNRIEYIHLMADYKLNKQIRAQCHAFKQGLGNVVPLDWLQMFNNKELQVLISGAQIPVDVNDLKQHTNYTGGYAANHPTIVSFWKIVDQFTDQQKSQLLKFVTSCSRPPLLGFKELDPPFCIQHAGTVDRLPTSSTCMNLLKLPEFPDEKTLQEKLLYAIQAGAGFELS
ncbi:ubiquitin-protein ligase E3C [Phymastichus coffea]|uniref:ubiquitin-protein ligase E3C n=1 Tax=Phymastichus coffea TaxID=108790 RepID=UPI00273C0A9A|nr:ubiquitin-protein ligase E3C [Phymastichus coffea]XP_058797924.1 ubiquitin-protein ligase E3C [Phymastichus coffea]XP_058797925.1 ubiquitin-protein ligase E3C [Phymastichus coffea]XP_058797926.1 ubiquitin-protein ligase E3C [Phymastichus coffea]